MEVDAGQDRVKCGQLGRNNVGEAGSEIGIHAYLHREGDASIMGIEVREEGGEALMEERRAHPRIY
jgi:hypothetical protein